MSKDIRTACFDYIKVFLGRLHGSNLQGNRIFPVATEVSDMAVFWADRDLGPNSLHADQNPPPAQGFTLPPCQPLGSVVGLVGLLRHLCRRWLC